MKPTRLIEHPEGGRFCEVFRSSARVVNSQGQDRSALTHIYFSLNPGEVSHFHRVCSDEVWNLYEGSGIDLYLWNGIDPVEKVKLSPLQREYCHVVPAGVWQAAVPLEGPALVGCSVGPGFEFADFEMMRHGDEAAKTLRIKAPELANMIIPTASIPD